VIYYKQDDIYLTFNVLMSINDREYWSGSTNWTIHRNWQRRSHKTKNKNQTKTSKKPNAMCVGHHSPQANTNNVNKTWALLQTTGGKDEPTIVSMQKSQHGTQSVKSYNRRTQNTKKMSNTDLNDRYIFCKSTTPMSFKRIY
jgi:hypothetical protein